jgi:maltokinase-like protein
MAVIHDTTMSPTKLEMLQAWLPAQPWYRGTGRAPRLARAGGFRLDDPAGAVGIEFMVVTDGSADPATSYLVPMTYRAGPLDAAGDALIGTAEHGVLGPRWIYDGPHDPVLVAQLVALIQGAAEPQAQNVSHTPDTSVIAHPAASGALTAAGSGVTASGAAGTEVQVQATGPDGAASGQFLVRINRVLQPGDSSVAALVAGDAGQPCVSATWRLTDGARARGVFATATYRPAQPAPR